MRNLDGLWTARAWFGRGRDGERPIVCTVLFWIGVLGPVLTRAFVFDPRMLSPWLLGVVAVVLLVLWPLLPWAGRPGWPAPSSLAPTLLAPILLALAASAYGLVDGTGFSAPMLLVSLAYAVLTLGVAPAIVIGLLQQAILAVGIRLAYEVGWANLGIQTVSNVLLGAMIIALAALVRQERGRREESVRLLAELQATHADLARRSEQVRELAIAEERARLAREVHDAVGHHLTVVKLGLTNAQRMRRRDEDAAWDEVADARQSAMSALDEVRRAVRALGPGPLASTSLGTALHHLVDSFDGDGLSADLTITGPVRALGPTVDATLYRIIEEGLTNVRRHAAGATRATVSLHYTPDGVRLSIADDGPLVGGLIDGFGLAGIRARLAELGGSLTVAAGERPGVELTALLPAMAGARR